MSVRKLLASVIITLNIFSCIELLFTCTQHFEDSKRTTYKLAEYIESLDGYNELKRISERLKVQISEECNRNTTTPPNPVSMYLYAKTVAEALSPIRDIISRTEDIQLKETVTSFISNLPTEVDVDGVVLSFVRLQNTYNISARDIASGNILGIKVPRLTADIPFNKPEISPTDIPYNKPDISPTDIPYNKPDISPTDIPFNKPDIS
ncbi:unnamed protein product [Mytilus coruscus]|uniref:Prolyl 4-hydroxylase N-terminal domain-containing protein n=1 Tax=Mytilus coruscus TaxID=42192 RepID=A0A6J8E1U3_MYTCO|nr:unnamed protein product [Mytilus coruscus]